MTNVLIVGGGVAGLVAAIQTAKAGISTVLLEKASLIGGRAMTREKNGFRFNLGPHALYRKGVLRQTLQEFGIPVHGSLPPTNGGFVIRAGRMHTLPVGLTSLMTTSVMGLAAKFEFAKLQTSLKSIDVTSLDHVALSSWLQTNIRHEEVRDVMRMLVRVTTFTNDPDRQSAGAALAQLQLAVAGNVLYLDDGWQTIVDGLRRVAIDAGVRIEAGAAAALDRADGRSVHAVRLADGRSVRAAAVIIAGSPADVDALTGVTRFERELTPVRLATLDLALRTLPQPRRVVAFGADEATYFSVHSAAARLAPDGGALIHVSKYLRPDEHADRATEAELERVTDRMQPGWRDALNSKQFLPNLTVTHAELLASRGGIGGRPSVQLDAFDNVFIAGDWVGARGQLSDAAAASGREAGASVRRLFGAGYAPDLKVRPTSVAQPFRAAHIA